VHQRCGRRRYCHREDNGSADAVARPYHGDAGGGEQRDHVFTAEDPVLLNRGLPLTREPVREPVPVDRIGVGVGVPLDYTELERWIRVGSERHQITVRRTVMPAIVRAVNEPGTACLRAGTQDALRPLQAGAQRHPERLRPSSSTHSRGYRPSPRQDGLQLVVRQRFAMPILVGAGEVWYRPRYHTADVRNVRPESVSHRIEAPADARLLVGGSSAERLGPRRGSVVFSSVAGAVGVVAGLMLLVGSLDSADFTQGAFTDAVQDSWGLYLTLLVLAFVGIFAQARQRVMMRRTIEEVWYAESR
jgi:hypothetical protein